MRAAADQLLCDSALTAVLFDGKGTLLDANDAAEQWSRKQRRAIAARDGGCVFPGCGRPPRHCDIHHLHHRGRGGPTCTGNGAMLCRFHHRLLHHHGWRLLIEDGRWVAIDAHGTPMDGTADAAGEHARRSTLTLPRPRCPVRRTDPHHPGPRDPSPGPSPGRPDLSPGRVTGALVPPRRALPSTGVAAQVSP